LGKNLIESKIKEMKTNPTINLRFQERDWEILQFIYNHDGVVARRHLKYEFWQDKGWRAMERRLSYLKAADYIQWPSLENRKTHPIPEPIIWLGWRGALLLAGKNGIDIPKPRQITEYQLVSLERQLRSRSFYWNRVPHWNNLKHDLTITDIRFWVQASIVQVPQISFEEWINESSFRIHTDFIQYKVLSRDNVWEMRKKGVIPDGCFSIVMNHPEKERASQRARYLLEIDMASHDNPSFGMEKVAPGIAYIKSPHYLKRFDSNFGTWLVVTTSKVRMQHLMLQTKERDIGSADLFNFTTLDQMGKSNFFLDPIWKSPYDHNFRRLIIV